MTSFQNLQPQNTFQRKQALMKRLRFGIMNSLTMIEKLFQSLMSLLIRLLSRHYLRLKKKLNFKMSRNSKRNANEDKSKRMRNGSKKSSQKPLKTTLRINFCKMLVIKEQLSQQSHTNSNQFKQQKLSCNMLLKPQLRTQLIPSFGEINLKTNSMSTIENFY